MTEQTPEGPLILSPIEIQCLFLAIDSQTKALQVELNRLTFRSPRWDSLTEISHHLAVARRVIERASEARKYPRVA